MDRTYAFVDESGNSDLNTLNGGSTGFLIVCSILVAEKDLEDAYAQAEALRKRHFQTGEIKSSNLKPKDSDRRARILNELADLPFRLYFTVVDKSQIRKDGGLRFKTSFIKYVNGLLYERLFSAYPDLQMIVDEHGGQEFQESLKSNGSSMTYLAIKMPSRRWPVRTTFWFRLQISSLAQSLISTKRKHRKKQFLPTKRSYAA
ncbi:DUF3800 domain-containing protein [Pseudomonas sp. Irchel 3F6]|uniref:DUF3800 domain-containing protein n=1 Tax=Pseudomonas sp. Irchel 3F6 TaxID=2009003 RepID=UPI0021153E24|nr:DUF3800 domain-containing protein [Pseudomonas sp. Irchel 3F6]